MTLDWHEYQSARQCLYFLQLNSQRLFNCIIGTTMTCLEDMRTWLFRDNPDKTFTYSIEDSGDIQEVIHRVTVHFPDIHPPDAFSEAVEFIHPTDRTAVQRTTVTYGENSLSWFDMKYRKGKESCPMCTSFVYNSTSQ